MLARHYKTIRRRDVSTPHVLKLDIQWRWGIAFKFRPIYYRRNSSRSKEMRMVGDPKADIEVCGEEKILFSLLGVESSDIWPVALSKHRLSGSGTFHLLWINKFQWNRYISRYRNSCLWHRTRNKTDSYVKVLPRTGHEGPAGE